MSLLGRLGVGLFSGLLPTPSVKPAVRRVSVSVGVWAALAGASGGGAATAPGLVSGFRRGRCGDPGNCIGRPFPLGPEWMESTVL